jgi:hypothetical protein
VDEVEVDVEQVGLVTLAPADEVVVPDLLGESASHVALPYVGKLVSVRETV